MQPFRQAGTLGVAAVLAVSLAILLPAEAPGQDNREKMIGHYMKGAQLFHMARYDEAKAEFDAMLKLKPTGDDAVILRERAGMDELIALWRDPRFRDQIRVILELSTERSEELAKDAANIQALIKQLSNPDTREVWQAIYRLSRIGPFVVPYLLDHLAVNEAPNPDSVSVSARIILRYMGVRATPPLLQALKARDLTLRIEICRLLASALDKRAVPELLALVEDERTDNLLRAAAGQALELILRMEEPGEPLPNAEAAYYRLASYYINDDPRIVTLVPKPERLVWRWKDAPEPGYAKKLVYEAPPDYLYGKMMAQQLLLDGFKVTQKSPRLLGLYVANNYIIYNTCLAMSKNDKLTEAERSEAAKYHKKLAYIHELNEQLGAENLYFALAKGMVDNDIPLVLSCIAGLRAVRDPRPAPGVKVLMSALIHPMRDVRTAAAEAIVWISPDGAICADKLQAELVMAGMHELLRATGHARVLVVTQSRTLYENLRPHLTQWGLESELALNSSAAMLRARQPLPPVDAILMDSQLQYETVGEFLKVLRADIRTMRLPVLVTCPAKLAADVAKDLQVRPVTYDEEGKIEPAVLKETLDAALKEYRAAEREEDVAAMRRGLVSLAYVPPGSNYPVTMLVPVLIALLTEQPAAISAVSLEVLAQLGDMRGFQPACRMFLDEKAPKALRERAGETAARLVSGVPKLPDDMVARLQDLASGQDAGLRTLATRVLAKANVKREAREETVLRLAGQQM